MSADLLVLFLLAMLFVIGYFCGVWITLHQHEQEIIAAKKDLKFWHDIAKKQADILNPNRHDKPQPPPPPGSEEKDAEQ